MISVITASIRPDGLKQVQESLAEQTFQNFEWLVEIGLMNKHDFSEAMNRGLKRAKGELIVFVNDYISLPIDGLQKFWDAYQKHPDTLFTAPLGQTKGEDISWDWRKNRSPDEPCNFMQWEIDLASAPKKILFEVGGFDETMDEFCWGPTNVNMGLRVELAGYKIRCLNTNPAVGFNHERTTDREDDLEYNNSRLDQFRRGLRLHFLG